MRHRYGVHREIVGTVVRNFETGQLVVHKGIWSSINLIGIAITLFYELLLLFLQIINLDIKYDRAPFARSAAADTWGRQGL